jgi:hypothetical protein
MWAQTIIKAIVHSKDFRRDRWICLALAILTVVFFIVGLFEKKTRTPLDLVRSAFSHIREPANPGDATKALGVINSGYSLRYFRIAQALLPKSSKSSTTEENLVAERVGDSANTSIRSTSDNDLLQFDESDDQEVRGVIDGVPEFRRGGNERLDSEKQVTHPFQHLSVVIG